MERDTNSTTHETHIELSQVNNSQQQPSREQQSHHVIPITVSYSNPMYHNSHDVPNLLRTSAGGESCCIFRVPECFVQINETAYEPRIVSIGPYHHGKEHLKMIQEHKQRFLEFFLSKSQENGVRLHDLVNSVCVLEKHVRQSYSENNGYDSNNLIHMMVLDGCFVLTLFCIVGRLVDYTEFDDPIFRVPWILPFIRSDLLRLENQIPFFVLRTLFEKSRLVSGGDEVESSRKLNELSFNFFSYGIERPVGSWEIYYNVNAKHLLDLLRKSFIPVSSEATLNSKDESSSDFRPFLRLIFSAKKLHLHGIKFQPRQNSCTFLDVKFKKGVLEIPPIPIDDFISSIFLNCIAFEQSCCDCSNHVTSYVAFMACLLKTPNDSGFLCDKQIVENYLGTDGEVSRFFKNIGKDVAFDINKSYLSRVFEDVNEYCSKGWHVQWAGFRHTHFGSPWSCLSSSAALALLLLSFIQAFFAAYAYFHPPDFKKHRLSL